MGKVYCSSDWHGCSKPALKLIEYLKPDDTLYFLGDAIDRGPDGLLLLKTIMNDPRIKMIKGNHEEFMEIALPKLLNDNYDGRDSSDAILWFNNGGYKTFDSIIDYSLEEIYEFIRFIKNLPTELRYISPENHTVILEHAGYTPWGIPHRSHNPLWDRDHFFDEYTYNQENIYMVHGHTPVQYLKYYYGYANQPEKTKEELKEQKEWMRGRKGTPPTVIRYCNGHKFDIDMCTIASDRVALLNLDTFETIYFDEEKE